MQSELVKNALSLIESDATFFEGIDPRIKNLFEQAKEDGTVSRFNIRDKSLLISTYRTKWFMILTRERLKLKSLKEARERWLSEATSVAAGAGTALPKVAIKTKLEGSAEAAKMQSQINEQEEVVNFIVGIKAIFDDFSFTINNSLNALEQENS